MWISICIQYRLSGGRLALIGKKGNREKILKALIELDSSFPETHFILSSIHYYNNDLIKAKDEFKIALRLSPNNPLFQDALKVCKKKIFERNLLK